MDKKRIATIILLFGIVVVSIGIGWLLGEKFSKKEEPIPPKEEEDTRETVKYTDIDFVEQKVIELDSMKIETEENKVKLSVIENNVVTKTIYSNDLTSKIVNIKLICDCNSCKNIFVQTEEDDVFTAIGNLEETPEIIETLEKLNIEKINNIGVSFIDEKTCDIQNLYLILKDNSVSKYKDTGLESVNIIN